MCNMDSIKSNENDILLPPNLIKHKDEIIIIDQLSEENKIGTIKRCKNIIKEIIIWNLEK